MNIYHVRYKLKNTICKTNLGNQLTPTF